MAIRYKGEKLKFDEAYLAEEGYEAPKVEVSALDGTTHTLGGRSELTTLLVSVPFVDEAISAELAEIAHYIEQVPHAHKRLIIATASDANTRFGEEYGLMSGEGLMIKCAFVLSKDGTIAYVQTPDNLEDSFNLTNLIGNFVKATNFYTGAGCHEI